MGAENKRQREWNYAGGGGGGEEKMAEVTAGLIPSRSRLCFLGVDTCLICELKQQKRLKYLSPDRILV